MTIEKSELVPKEYELIYGAKERKEDILSNTMGLPFQKVKQFGTTKKNEWENKLILGDNLQVTKYLLKLKKEGKLQNPDGTDGFKLICIDPPFATKQEFRGRIGEQAYSDKIIGSEFIEFLRKRLIILHELLTEDGSIFVHMDYRNSHYAKVILDEIFGGSNFRNEIIWKRSTGHPLSIKKFESITDSILVYAKSENVYFSSVSHPLKDEVIQRDYKYKDEHGFYQNVDLTGGKGGGKEAYAPFNGTLPTKGRAWAPPRREKLPIWAAEKLPVNYEKMNQLEKCHALDKIGLIYWSKSKNPRFKRYLPDNPTRFVTNLWDDVNAISSQAKERIGYPTQKPEILLERIIKSSTNDGDLILDSFCGSGTAVAVAEKMSRRWVGIDSSKFSIYTCQKRMLDLKKKIGNTGQPLKTKPFGVYNAGLYIDGPHLKELDDEEYCDFALELFQAEPVTLELNGFEMDGILMNSPVHIFPRDGSLTEEYIENLDKEVGKFLKERMFIIVPANRVYFLQDYIEIKGRRYYALRIPYSIIDELHKKKFVRPWQPASETDMNQVIDSVGFDFIHPPEVEAEYNKKSKDELEIKIKKFESVQRTKNPIEFKDKESLSMVLIDKEYNGDYFNMTDFFFADQVKNDKWKIKLSYEHDSKKIMIIYLDVLGNERKEVKNLKDFRGKKN